LSDSINIRVISRGKRAVIVTGKGNSLLDILRQNGYSIYAPCGGKGTCGKCLISLSGSGPVLACTFFPGSDMEIELPGKEEANILVSTTAFLEDMPVDRSDDLHISTDPHGMAIDIGTTTVVIYFIHQLSGQIKKIASFLNPQHVFGSDVISRISYCQLNESGLAQLQRSIMDAINIEIDTFIQSESITADDIEKVIVAGNTTMLHILLGTDPVPIAIAPFKPAFLYKQTRKAVSIGLKINPAAEIVTLPCISAFVGADIVAGLAALKVSYKNYLFLDIGTNGEMALVKGREISVCATAAGPAFEGANISCGMGAVTGAISVFSDEKSYHVIGNTIPRGICGSGIIDIVAYMLKSNLIDETGFLKETYIINKKNNIGITQQDIREIQLAKSAIYSGLKILLSQAGLTYDDVDALFLAGGFGHYINVSSALKIGLLPHELEGKIYSVGNSAGFGALQYLKSKEFEGKTVNIMENSKYIELSNRDDFTMEFALNMNFTAFA
jgi:uncharacterized 2Fe-2S/4Fe-4S cluster protein (DUF4445 family)